MGRAVVREGWVSTSADAKRWTTVSEGSVGHLNAVAFFNGSFVALSDLGWSLRSPDAVTWTRSEVVPHPSVHAVGFCARALAHGGGALVAVGRRTRFDWTGMWMRSTDGFAWVAASTAAPPVELTAVLHDGRRFVAVDRGGNVHESTDGDAWKALGAVSGQPELYGIAYGNGVYVAVGSQGVLARSADGVGWSLSAPILSSVDPSTPATMDAVTFDGARFIAVGRDRTSAVSTDGTTWTSRGSTGLPASVVAPVAAWSSQARLAPSCPAAMA